MIKLKEEAKSISDIFYTIVIPNGCTVYIDKVLHNNCQTFSIGNVNSFIDNDNRYKNEEIIDIFRKCYRIAYKNQFLIDINEKYESKIEKLFPEKDIVFKQKYKNSNKSKMTMYLIKSDILKN